ncbi:hypothetical protein NQZ68_014681 [Dissostichus eleginoides]|nr:hypothetical protein NQZ68_014681 [Dissostichus eleginoides]
MDACLEPGMHTSPCNWVSVDLEFRLFFGSEGPAEGRKLLVNRAWMGAVGRKQLQTYGRTCETCEGQPKVRWAPVMGFSRRLALQNYDIPSEKVAQITVAAAVRSSSARIKRKVSPDCE